MKTAEETIEELQNKIGRCFADCVEDNKSDVIEAMKAYAMQECEKLRQQCADNVDSEHTFLYSSERNVCDLVEQSILSTPIELT